MCHTVSNIVELLSGTGANSLDCVVDVALLGESHGTTQVTLNRLAMEASRYGLQFSLSMCEGIAQDWREAARGFTAPESELEAVDSFMYMDSPTSAGG